MAFGIGDVKDSIDLLRKSIEDRVSKEQVQTIVDTSNALREFLKTCPDELAEKIKLAINGTEISQQIIEHHVMKHLGKMLDNVNSLSEFLQTHSILRNMAAFSVVAATASTVLIPILTLAAEYSKNKENKRFHEAI